MRCDLPVDRRLALPLPAACALPLFVTLSRCVAVYRLFRCSAVVAGLRCLGDPLRYRGSVVDCVVVVRYSRSCSLGELFDCSVVVACCYAVVAVAVGVVVAVTVVVACSAVVVRCRLVPFLAVTRCRLRYRCCAICPPAFCVVVLTRVVPFVGAFDSAVVTALPAVCVCLPFAWMPLPSAVAGCPCSLPWFLLVAALR